jgi:ATP-dependent RNA helicase SUPV3L1/SUV3
MYYFFLQMNFSAFTFTISFDKVLIPTTQYSIINLQLRPMKRKIVYLCGPTNSGKTYNALQRFMEAKKGIYCRPLRLLAMEVFDKVNMKGVYWSMLTCQGKKLIPFQIMLHACTVEMALTKEVYDVTIVDEIQMD